MAITQSELVTALQTLFNTVKFRIRNRYGTESLLDLNKMKAGELAFCTDTHRLYACFADGQAQLVSNGITIKGYYADLTALQAAHPTGSAGDIYAVGASPQHLYLWTTAWTDMGSWNDMSLYATVGSLAALDTRVGELEDHTALIGEVKIWPTATAPEKYLICDGSAISRATYADLFAILGTLYGTGDGSTTFNLPNLKKKIPVGQDTSDAAFDVCGDQVGAATHKHTTSILGGNFALNQAGAHYIAASATDGVSSTAFESSSVSSYQPSVIMNYIIRALA